MDSWKRLLKLAYKWGTLPAVLLGLFCGQGWDAIRVAQGYAQTSGIITQYRCSKIVVVQFTYSVDGTVHQGASSSALSSFACPPYHPGEPVRVFYSTRRPELALMNTTPRQALQHQFLVVLAILLLFPFATFFAAYRESSNDP